MEVTLTNYYTITFHYLFFDDNAYDKESCFQVHSANQNILSGQRRSEERIELQNHRMANNASWPGKIHARMPGHTANC